MTIHHATIKNAAKFGIEVKEIDTFDGPRAMAIINDAGYCHRDPKIAVAIAKVQKTLEAEYPGIALNQKDEASNEFTLQTDAETVLATFEATSVDSITLADCLEAAQNAGVDPEEGADEEEEYTGVVVPAKYKTKYKEAGHPNHCGDWIAATLDGVFAVVDDGTLRFDPEKFLAFLQENGVDLSGKWAAIPEGKRNGWQGRFRMNGRQRLEKVVAHRGTMLLNGKELTVPKPDLELLREKHPQKD